MGDPHAVARQKTVSIAVNTLLAKTDVPNQC